MHVLVVTNREQQFELLGKERVVIFQREAEERERLDERPPPGHDLGPASGEQIQRREILEDAHRIGGAEHRDRTRQPDPFRAGGGGAEDHRRRGIEELTPVMFPDTERGEPDPIGQHDLVDQIAQRPGSTCGIIGRIRGRGGEAVDADFDRTGQRSILRLRRRA